MYNSRRAKKKMKKKEEEGLRLCLSLYMNTVLLVQLVVELVLKYFESENERKYRRDAEVKL